MALWAAILVGEAGGKSTMATGFEEILRLEVCHKSSITQG